MMIRAISSSFYRAEMQAGADGSVAPRALLQIANQCSQRRTHQPSHLFAYSEVVIKSKTRPVGHCIEQKAARNFVGSGQTPVSEKFRDLLVEAIGRKQHQVRSLAVRIAAGQSPPPPRRSNWRTCSSLLRSTEYPTIAGPP